MKSFKDSASYRDFVNKRNATLEQALLTMRGKLARFQAQYQNDVVNALRSLLMAYSSDPKSFVDYGAAQRILSEIAPIQRTVAEIIRFRMFAYLLSARSEAKAVSIATGNEVAQPISRSELESVSSSAMGSVADIRSMVQFNYDKLARRIMDAFQIATLMGLSVEEVLDRVRSAMPKAVARTRIKKLQRVKREADITIKTGFQDEDLWRSLVANYIEELPVDRSPAGKLDPPLTTSEGEVLLYDWELERAVTEDFVDKVRKGQHAGASKAGIKDFMWVAVLDDRTDECCIKRDGLLVSEIERKLKTSWKSDDCKASTPPAHFNCRCDIVPVDESLPDRPPDGREEFDEWLKTTI